MAKMIELNVDGLKAEVSQELVDDVKITHGIDIIAELTEVLKKEAAIERERFKDKENGIG